MACSGTGAPRESFGPGRPLASTAPAGSEGLFFLPYLTGEIIWAARHEMALTVEDFLARRTRALLLDARASQAMAPRVAELLAAELGFDSAWQAEQVRVYRELADGYLLHPDAVPVATLPA